MTIEPLVSVNILSFNRKDDLRLTLKKVFEQHYKNIEVIVVDNASTDGTIEMVKNEFPSLHLIELTKNIGIAGWNEGFKIAKGEFILVLDDDSYPKKSSITAGVELLRKNNNIGIAAYHIFNASTNRFENSKFEDNSIPPEFVGCGALIRSSIFPTVGYFADYLFLYVHEIEYSMRVINAGFRIVFIPDAIAVHCMSNKHRVERGNNRIDHRKVFYFTRNWLIILFTHFPLTIVSFRIFRIVIGRIFFGVVNNCLWSVIKAIYLAGVFMVWHRKKREVLNQNTQAVYNYGASAGGFFFSEGQYGFKRPQWI